MNTSTVADRPLSFAATLRRVADLVRNGQVTYNWSESDQCNMGLVARASLGLSLRDFRKLEKPVEEEPYWGARAEAHCPLTGTPTLKLFRQLQEVGFRFEDYNQLEDLSNSEIVERIKRDGLFVENTTRRTWFGRKMPVTVQRQLKKDEEQSLIVYLDTWATMIEEFHAASPHLEAVELRPLVSK